MTKDMASKIPLTTKVCFMSIEPPPCFAAGLDVFMFFFMDVVNEDTQEKEEWQSGLTKYGAGQ